MRTVGWPHAYGLYDQYHFFIQNACDVESSRMFWTHPLLFNHSTVKAVINRCTSKQILSRGSLKCSIRNMKRTHPWILLAFNAHNTGRIQHTDLDVHAIIYHYHVHFAYCIRKKPMHAIRVQKAMETTPISTTHTFVNPTVHTQSINIYKIYNIRQPVTTLTHE